MKIELEQGSENWLTWRKSLVTASDVAVLLGKGKYGKTPLSLWEEKMSMRTQFVTDAMRRGTMYEPKIRQMLIDLIDIWIEPCCFASDEFPFLGASLDGYNDPESLVVEIKTGKEDLFKMIKSGEAREDHYIQLQTQMLVTGASKGILAVLNPSDDNNIAYCNFVPDTSLHKEIVAISEKFFYDYILTKLPPKSLESAKPELTDTESKKTAERLDYLKGLIDGHKKEYDALRQKMIEKSKGKECRFFGWDLSTRLVGGTDYEKIIEDYSVDISKYQKPKKPQVYLSKEK